MSRYFDRQGKPLAMMDWARKFEDREYATVAQHWVRGWMVSTVWLGLDHNFSMSGPPIIFETMVFPPGDEASSTASSLRSIASATRPRRRHGPATTGRSRGL